MNILSEFPSNVFLAPMAGITDCPMREIVHSQSEGKVTIVSEMVAINALSRKNPKTYRIADVRNENYPVIVQLVGSNPDLFADAAQLAAELGAFSIDINMGCPVRKITAGGAGSALMKDLPLAAQIIRKTVDAVKLRVSVKFRKGWDNDTSNAVDFAKMCQDNGAAFVTVHGRTRAQGYSGFADWQIIRQVKNAVTIPVIGNGDIDSPLRAQQMLEQTGADGVMVGRAALGAPWLPGQIDNFLHHQLNPVEKSQAQIWAVVREHIGKLKIYYGEKLALALSRKYVCWYCKNFYDAKRFRENYMKINDYQTALELIDCFFQQQNHALMAETLEGKG